MEIEKRYYTIGEVAEQFNVSASLIRFWEAQFRQISPRKNKNGVRQYTKEDIEVFGTIYHLVKEKGYTLSGAKELLKNKTSLSDNVEMVQSLERVKSFLLSLKEDIKRNTQHTPLNNTEDDHRSTEGNQE